MTTDRPVVLVHGTGSTFEHNWRRHGWVDLLEAEGRRVLPFHLPGHGGEPLESGPDDTGPHRLVALAAEEGQVDVVGFSAGSVLTLTAATLAPGAFAGLVLMGLADVQLQTTREIKQASLDASLADPNNPIMRGIRLAAERAGNRFEDCVAGAVSHQPLPTFEELAKVDLPVLLVLGELDQIGSADRLLTVLPHARLVSLPGTDHFSTTQRFEAQEAALSFLAETRGDG